MKEITVSELRRRSVFIATPMYDGMCTLPYHQSLLGTSFEMTRYGIKFIPYYLGNESLIQRARNYCAAQFLDSGCTHLLFIDADIEWRPEAVLDLLTWADPQSDKDVICAPYPKKSCPAGTLIETEDGPKKIKWLVDNKYSGKVLALDDTGRFVWNSVISHSVAQVPGKRWVNIGRNHMKPLICTDDHECAVTDDVLSPSVYYQEAKDILGKYIIRRPKKNGKQTINPLYNPEQLSFLIGTLFGDGSINSKGYLKFGHSEKQLAYLNLKRSLFGCTSFRGPITYGNYKGREYSAFFLDCPRNAQIEHLRDLMYIDGKKTVKHVINLLDERALAFWFLDDGTLGNSNTVNPYPILCTDAFTEEDQHLICETLKSKWGIEATLRKTGAGNWRIGILTKSADTFFNLIAPFVIPEMEYKLPETHRGGRKHVFDSRPLDYAAEKVKRIIDLDPTVPRKQYDIGVEHTPNFVANGYVVHNCLTPEKIINAVKKGFIKKEDDLYKFVGDFVFNVGQTTTEISGDKPFKIREGGTGFMMIQRHAIEKVIDRFPDIMYRPDHKRDKAFDGTRMIPALFDCEIDKGTFAADLWKTIREIAKGDVDAVETCQAILDKANQASLRYLSEDYQFCRMAEEAGCGVWMAPWIHLAHVGRFVFGGSLMEMLKVGEGHAIGNTFRQPQEVPTFSSSEPTVLTPF